VVANTRTIYIDHSIVSCEQLWPGLKRAIASGNLKLALSLWNLFEIGAADDKGQQDRRLSFLQGFNPLWVVERRAVQKQEVKRFLWSHKFGAEAEELVVITPSLSVVDHFLSGSEMRIGLTAEQFISGIDYQTLNPLKKLSPEAQSTMKATNSKVLKEKDHEIFTGWIWQSIPLRGPNGKLFTSVARTDLAEFCFQNRRHFLAACPSMAVEDAVTTDRANDRMRKPTESDGPDLMHTAVAMAYCDIFFTRDKYQARNSDAASRMLKGIRLAELCTDPNQLAQSVDAMGP
jgi:hypothetical protein